MQLFGRDHANACARTQGQVVMSREIKARAIVGAGAGRAPKGNKRRSGSPAPGKPGQGESCQDRVLDEWRRLATELDVYLRNGTRIRGVLRGFDTFVMAIEADEGLRVVYKQVVLTVAPAGAVSHDDAVSKRPVITLKRRGPLA
jgi:host factor-I protein